MFRQFKPKKRNVNVILLNGGVGDHIGGSFIAIDYAASRYPWIYFMVWVPDSLLEIAQNLIKGCLIRSFSDMKKKYDKNITTLTTSWDGRFSPMKTHQTTYAFNVLLDETPRIVDMNYLRVDTKNIDISRFNLNNYVTIAPLYTAPVREFNADTINEISDYLLSKNITPVFIGRAETKTGTIHNIQGNLNSRINITKGINLIDQTSLLETAKIIEQSKAIIGVDNGLLHLAACTDVDIIAGYTTVDPKYRVPTRNNSQGFKWHPVTPDEDLKCRFCQSNSNFLYGHDYRFCYEEDYLCVKQLTSNKYIEILDKIL